MSPCVDHPVTRRARDSHNPSKHNLPLTPGAAGACWSHREESKADPRAEAQVRNLYSAPTPGRCATKIGENEGVGNEIEEFQVLRKSYYSSPSSSASERWKNSGAPVVTAGAATPEERCQITAALVCRMHCSVMHQSRSVGVGRVLRKVRDRCKRRSRTSSGYLSFTQALLALVFGSPYLDRERVWQKTTLSGSRYCLATMLFCSHL